MAALEQQSLFIPLYVHSSYSLLESSIRIDNLIAHAQRHKLPAIALTDKNNLFGALEFTEKCLKAGIQPIIGCEISYSFEDAGGGTSKDYRDQEKNLNSLILLAANDKGYQNLTKLSSLAFLGELDEKGERIPPQLPHVSFSAIETHQEGLIAISGGDRNILVRALTEDQFSQAEKACQKLKQTFQDRFYIGLQRLDENYDRYLESQIVNLAYKLEVPLVALNEAFFEKAEDHDVHEVLLAIADGQIVGGSQSRTVNCGCYLRSTEEMYNIFADLAEALHNSVEIARRCHTLSPSRKAILPRFSEDETRDLVQQAQEGLKRRLEKTGPAKDYRKEDYEERLHYELEIIEKMGFSGYFLIVSDFIKWAKDHNIPVGPGRGSGAGSLVAYALTITDIDPLRFSLLFERFLNPERVSMPDFDIDFCQDGREYVIEYVTQKYSLQQVAQIITFGSLQARGVLRDVGRVLAMSYNEVDRICKAIPQEVGTHTPLRELLKAPEMRDAASDPKIARLFNFAQELEGLYRHASTHAAGIVIGDRSLDELVPLYRDPRSPMQVTQFNMKYVEKAGLVKFDFLGLKTLSVIKATKDLIHDRDKTIDFSLLPLDDKKTYALLSRAESLGIFQLESSGMRDTLLQMQPDCIEDLIALVALYRPGPMENIPLYSDRKHGRQPIGSIHEKIDYLLKETQGVIVYQEQVMQIAQILAGYSLGEADLLRRAMGKKIHEEMAQQRSRFQEGAVKNGVNEKKAAEIFDLLAKFADYGFNKSHAAAYAMVAYETAYLKAHYPAEFIAASMTYELNNAEKLDEFRQEAKRLNIEVVPPSVNECGEFFSVRNNKIYYALSAIKGVGVEAAAHIAQLSKQTPFQDLEDFFKRIDRKKVNKRALEGLVKGGAFDKFGIARDVICANIDELNRWAQALQEEQANSEQSFLFGEDKNFAEQSFVFKKPEEAWTTSQRLGEEFKSLGFYLSGHPLDAYRHYLDSKNVLSYIDIKQNNQERETVTLAGTLISITFKRSKRNTRLAILLFSDGSASYEILIFEKEWGNLATPPIVGESYLVFARVQYLENDVRLNFIGLEGLAQASKKACKQLTIIFANYAKYKAYEESNFFQIIKQFETTDGQPIYLKFYLSKQTKACGEKICIKLPKRYALSKDLLDNLERLGLDLQLRLE